MASQQNVVLVGATDIRENVIVPFQQVKWVMRGWVRNTPVIYADGGTIMVFDPEQKLLHCVHKGVSYCTHRITRIVTNAYITMMEVEMDSGVAVQATLVQQGPTRKQRARLIKLTAGDWLTQRRILALQVANNS